MDGWMRTWDEVDMYSDLLRLVINRGDKYCEERERGPEGVDIFILGVGSKTGGRG